VSHTNPAALLSQGLISRPGHLAVVEDTIGVTGSRGRVLRARVLDGMDVEILCDRGLDLGAAWFNGRPLSWASPIRDASRLPSATGTEWLTRFNGGMVTTCGLENVGPSTPDDGMHGSHSHQLAHDVTWTTEVIDDGPKVVVTGTIDSARLFGRRVYVYRTITVHAPTDGQPYVSVKDIVRNEGTTPARAALLYHVNFGAPTVMPGTRVLVESSSVTAREPCACVPSAKELPDPTNEMTEAVFEYAGVPVHDSLSTAVIRTPEMARDVELTWSAGSLPRLCQWVFPTRGGWALGLEPGNSPMWGPDRVGEDHGAPVLAPGAELTATVRVRLLAPAS
jgi:hypothetical protein